MRTLRPLLFLFLMGYALTQAVLPLAVETFAPAPGPVSLPEIAGNPAALSAMAEEHRFAAVRVLRQYARAQYQSMADQLASDSEARQARNRALANRIFDIARWASLLVLLLPIWFWRRHKYRRKVLVASSVFAALLFLVGMSLLGGLFTALNDVSLNLAHQLDPKRAMLDASFDLFLDRTVPLLVESDAPWIDVISEEEGAEVRGFSERLFQNLSALHEYAFVPAMRMFRIWRQVAGTIPLALVVATALLFLLSVRPVIESLVTLPDRAASGEPRAVRRALGMLGGTVWKEFLSILMLLLFVIVLSVLITGAMRQLNRAAVRMLVSQVEVGVEWLGVADPEGSFAVVVAMSSLPALLLVSIALMAVSSILWTFHARRICRARFHDRVRLRDHQRFWRRTSWALIQVHWIPVVFMTIAAPLVRAIIQGPGSAPVRLVTSSVVLVLGFAATFWFFRGWRAMKRLWRWAPAEGPTPPQVPEANSGSDECAFSAARRG